MKKLLSLLISFGIFLPVTFAGFPDVPETNQYFDAISYIQSQGIVNGFSDGTFRSDEKITRAAFLKIIIEAKFKDEEIKSCTTRIPSGDQEYAYFIDTKTDQWYIDYVCMGKEKEIITGDFEKGTFRPSDNISFAEASKVIITAFRYPTNNFAEGYWYRPYVHALAEKNAIPVAIRGFDQEISRGQMSEIIYRLLAEVTDKPSQTYFSIADSNE